jgi:hypothetical protein
MINFAKYMSVILVLMFMGSGCTGIGPARIDRDRFNYISAISESWKRQTLLNLVKTRYADAPVFMDISSVISQYVLESDIRFGAVFAQSDTQTMGFGGKLTDRPTITYIPLTGENFARSMMTPIPVNAILLLIEAGYPVDYVMRICVQTINGIGNRFGGHLMERNADPRFYELLTLMKNIQVRGGLGMRVKSKDGKKVMIFFFRALKDKTSMREVQRIRELLGLAAGEIKFKASYGSFHSEDTEIAILSRSLMQIMIEYASYIDVPEDDIESGRVNRTLLGEPDIDTKFLPLLKIKSSNSKPDNSYTSVRYKDKWFWIDDRDLNTKSVFNFLIILFSLTERDVQKDAPIVTVPTN